MPESRSWCGAYDVTRGAPRLTSETGLCVKHHEPGYYQRRFSTETWKFSKETLMKFRFSRSTGAPTQPAKAKRPGRFAGARALDSERPTRLYSLLLPPASNSTRR